MMGSVLEKITLYDILGYLFPGCVLTMMISTAYRDQTLNLMAEMGDNTGILYFAFFLISYLLGIAVSETAAIILPCCKKVKGFIAGKFGRKKPQIDLFWKEQMIKALIKSGICSDENEIRNNLNNDLGYYMPYMYGVVQSSSEYRRIHNYKSACVMYKNLIFALMAGDIIMCMCRTADIYVYVSCIVICILLVRRYGRFSVKTNEYTVTWFIDKFHE